MFASRAVNRLLFGTLSATSGVTDVVADRIVRGLAFPQGTQLPALRFYLEQSSYDFDGVGAIRADQIMGESMRYVVSLDDIGTSDQRIAPAADAQLAALAGRVFDLPTGEQVTFRAQGEIPITSYVDGGQVFQRLGTIYSVTVTRGG